MMTDITNALLKDLAEQIILSHTEDIEYLSVWEMTADHFDFNDDDLKAAWQKLSHEQQEELIQKVDKYVSQAEVTVRFPEED
jgi:hypothetical protein